MLRMCRCPRGLYISYLEKENFIELDSTKVSFENQVNAKHCRTWGKNGLDEWKRT
jgi:hypothetical protein